MAVVLFAKTVNTHIFKNVFWASSFRLLNATKNLTVKYCIGYEQIKRFPFCESKCICFNNKIKLLTMETSYNVWSCCMCKYNGQHSANISMSVQWFPLVQWEFPPLSPSRAILKISTEGWEMWGASWWRDGGECFIAQTKIPALMEYSHSATLDTTLCTPIFPGFLYIVLIFTSEWIRNKSYR